MAIRTVAIAAPVKREPRSVAAICTGSGVQSGGWSIIVALSSPMDRAKQSPAAPMSEGSGSGSLIRHRTYPGRAPRLAAAGSYAGSRRASAAETDWYAKAVTRTVWARITIQCVPLSSTGGRLKASSTHRPTTTDATATGSTKSASSSRLPRRPSRAAASAAQPPASSASRPAVTAVTRLVVSASGELPLVAAS